jgi:hypothetical protein
MPESPRWLVFQGRTEEARDVLHSLHGATPGYSADEEVAILKQAYDEEMALEKPSIWAVFKGSDRRRALISMGVMCLQQAQGSSCTLSLFLPFLQFSGADSFRQNRHDQLHRSLPHCARHEQRLPVELVSALCLAPGLILTIFSLFSTEP